MPYLIMRAAGGFQRTPIPPTGLGLRRDAGSVALVGAEDERAVARLYTVEEHGAPRVAMVCAAGVPGLFLDGARPLGVELLGERAELSLGGVRLHVTERAPFVVAPFVGDAGHRCAVCADAVEPGDAAVVCPGCRAVHHEGTFARAEGGARACFSYRGGACADCDLSRAECEWIPEEAP